jgi:hypothetical protein
MKTKFRPDIIAAVFLTSFMWSTPASATGFFREIFCTFFRCGGRPGGGGGGGGASPVPEIDAGAGLAAVALVVSVAAVAYRRYSK